MNPEDFWVIKVDPPYPWPPPPGSTQSEFAAWRSKVRSIKLADFRAWFMQFMGMS
jgi:hypothetical protein